MKIIIVGCGKIGTTIVADLTAEGHDVIAVDRNQATIEEISNIYDVMCVCGNGSDNDTLRAFMEGMDVAERKAFETELENQCLLADVPYLVETIDEECKTVVALLMSTKANTVIVPMHDVLRFGALYGVRRRHERVHAALRLRQL